MSRTYKTAPAFVRARRHGFVEAQHDHRFGPCDLPETIDESAGRCTWVIGEAFGWARHGKCPCWRCHEGPWRSQRERRERHRARARAHRGAEACDE